MCTAECSIVLNSDGIVTKKTLINSIRYSYDKEGQLIKKIITSSNKVEADTVINYEYNGDSEVITDDFGRKTFDEVQTGIGFITRQFTYHKGKFTDEHKNNEKLKSGPVTNLVKRIEMSDGRILSYEYDKEERIRKVTESNDKEPDTVVSETVYTYDSLGQLIKEIRDGVVINEMT